MAVSLCVAEQQLLAIDRGLMSLSRLLMLEKLSRGLAHILVKLVFKSSKGSTEKASSSCLGNGMFIQPFRLSARRILWKQGVSPCKAEGSP